MDAKLRSLRATKGWTLLQVAEASGLTEPVIHRIEKGHVKNPGIWTMQKLATVYGVTLDYLTNPQVASVGAVVSDWLDGQDVEINERQQQYLLKVLTALTPLLSKE